VILEATACVFTSKRLVERKPANRAGNVVRAAQHLAVHENPRANARAHRQKNGVATTTSRALPGFSANASRPIIVHNDAHVSPPER
jgi:hypothetical protein